LIEVQQLQVGANLHFSLVRDNVAQEDTQQSGLATAIGANEADAVSPQDAGGEIADERGVAVAVRDPGGLDDDLAGGVGLLQFETGLAAKLPPLLTLSPHALEGTHPSFIAGTASLDALSYPAFLFGQPFVELHIGFFFRFQLLLAEGQEALVIAVPTAQTAAVHLDDAGGRALQEFA